MKLECAVFVIFTSFLVICEGQVHYVPAQVLIPVYNATVYNHSEPNYGWKPNNTQSYQPGNYGWNVPNYNQTIYNKPPIATYGRNNSILNTTTPDGNLLIGTIGTYDRLLFSKEYFKDSRWWSSREKTIEYPKDLPSGYLRHETISAIRIYNHLYNPTKARAQILDGGVGRQIVKIKLSSNWGNGFKFLVQIYGH